MKSFNSLADKLDKMAEKLDKRIEEKLEETATSIWEDIIANAPYKTGEYISSIQIYPIEKDRNSMKIFIGSDMVVGPAKSNGNRYNLGFLLEHGTNPHDIYPVDSEYLVFYVTDKETGKRKKIRTRHVWHPGTVAQPHYALALEKNKKLLKDNIREAWRQL